MFINTIMRKVKYFINTAGTKNGGFVYEEKMPQDIESARFLGSDEDGIRSVRDGQEKHTDKEPTQKTEPASESEKKQSENKEAPQKEASEDEAAKKKSETESPGAEQQEQKKEDKCDKGQQGDLPQTEKGKKQSPEQSKEMPKESGQNNENSQQSKKKPPEVSQKLEEKVKQLTDMFGGSSDIKVRKFLFGKNNEYSAAIIYIDGLTDNMIIIDSIMRPLINYKDYEKTDDPECPDRLEVSLLKSSVLFNNEVEETADLGKMAEGCLNGDTVLIVENYSKSLIIGTKGYKFRSVTEPQTEAVVKGPREGFVENLRTNTSLIRRKIKSTALRTESFKIGRKTNTDVCLMYIENVARPELVNTVRERLQNINVDSISESGYIDEYIEDNPYSIFTTIGYTEKPDVVAGKILEGRVAVVVDNTPFVLTIPMFFIESLQTPDDYYNRSFYSSLLRLLRLTAYLIAILAVPIYIALTTFHREMLPTQFLFTIMNAREGTPFPVLVESLIMVVAFEILREAGLRLPRPIGQSVSIVGALIMGEAAVSAGLVGTPIVITVALSAVAGFTIPLQAETISTTRIMMMILASVLGGFGITTGLLLMLVHLAKLKSFGIPYFPAVNPDSDLKDSFVRLPLWSMVRRPIYLAGEDKTRRVKKIPPVPEVGNAPKN